MMDFDGQMDTTLTNAGRFYSIYMDIQGGFSPSFNLYAKLLILQK